jgi:hypothetical protein
MGQFGHVMPKEMLVPAATPNADGTPSYTQVVPVPDEIRVWDKAHPRFGDAVDSAFIARRRYTVHLIPMQCCFILCVESCYEYVTVLSSPVMLARIVCEWRFRSNSYLLCATVTCNLSLYHTVWQT